MMDLWPWQKRELVPTQPVEQPVVDASEAPQITEAKKRFNAVLTEALPPEQIAQHLHFVCALTDKGHGFSLTVKAARALVERLRQLGFVQESRFNSYQDSGRTLPYTAADAVNAFRSHCETMLQKKFANATDDTDFPLLRVEIILEYKK